MTSGIVIVAWNGEPYIEACVRSALDQTDPPRQIVVVDNASGDRSTAIVKGLENGAAERGIVLTVISESDNTGFTRGANTGLRLLLAEEVAVDVAVLLNQDAMLDPAWCQAVGEVFQADTCAGAIGAKILGPNRLTIQHAGGYLERPRLIGHHFGHHQTDRRGDFDALREVEFVTAAAMAIRTAALSDVGLFDEVFSPGYYEDVDLCARLRASGWKVLYAPGAVATHVESASFSRRPDRLSLSHRNRLIYALPFLIEPVFRNEFCLAERRGFTSDTPVEERRALALAYLSVVLLMPEVMKARLLPDVVTAELATDLIETFGQLRRDLIETGAISRTLQDDWHEC